MLHPGKVGLLGLEEGRGRGSERGDTPEGTPIHYQIYLKFLL